MGRLDGKVAAVTGGANGLGSAIVEQYAMEGAAVVFGDVLVADGEGLAGKLRADGFDVEFVRTDVTSSDDIAALVAHANGKHGHLEIMTANAGILGRAHRKSLVDIADDEIRELFEVNFMGVWWSLQHAIPAISASGGGAITVTSSVSAVRGLPKAPGYSASKGAIVALARSVAADLFPLIRVNVVAPGAMATQIAKNAALARGEDVSAVFAHGHPDGLADPIFTARTHLFLVSDEAAEINGQVFLVDGGKSNLHP